MDENRISAELNRLLVSMGRSLLQYVGEAWPWTSASEQDVRTKLDELVARQRSQVARISQLLERRDCVIDFGTYPTDYTDLHYVALDYLLVHLVENQRSVVAAIESAQRAASEVNDIQDLLKQVLADQRECLAELEALAKEAASASPA